MDHHSFNNVLLTSSDLSQLSGAAHEFIEKEKDPETGKEVSVLPSLKYFFPAIPKPNMKTLPASSDQKVQNAIFLREVRLLWNECKKELDRKIEILQRGSARGGKKEEEKAEDSKEEKDEEEEKSTKERSESKEPESSFDIAAPRNKSLTSILNDLSIKVLREWIEEDEDKAIAKTKADLEEKISSSKKSHEQFVKHKDRCPCFFFFIPFYFMRLYNFFFLFIFQRLIKICHSN